MLGAGKSQQAEDGGTNVEGLRSGSNTAAAFSFGKYQLFASLGRGGMADVFLAVSRGPMGFNKLVVIKRLRPALAEEAAFRQMFLDEARLAARLNHPNVVHTYEVGEHHGIYFIAMEYLEGQSLNKVIKEAAKRGEKIDPVYCARMIADAVSGLHHAHELRDYDGRPLNIIHRDVSPHNIFATYDGHVKLVDFGIAKAALSSTETEVGVLKGKVAYMAPEQAMGGPIDARADIFAMGIVLWELLTQQRLMTGDSAANTLHRLMNVPIPRVSSVMPEIDPGLDAIVAKALEKEPAKRFQSGAEMRDALETWINSTGRMVKQDEVGRVIGGMFLRLREEVQRQIQTHMAVVATASTTGELQALTADSLKRLEQNGNTKLLRLGGSGSGSGVISAPPPPMADPSQQQMPPHPHSQAAMTQSSQVSSVMPPMHSHSHPPQTHPSQFHGLAPQQPQQQGGGGRAALLVVALLLGLGFLVTLALLLRPHVKSNPVATVDSSVPLGTSPSASTTSVTTAPSSVTADPSASSLLATNAPTASAPPTPTDTPLATPTTTGRKPPPHPTNTHRVPPPPPPPPPTTTVTPASDDPGFLTLQTYPFTKVSEGGRALGTTPLVKLSLTPGTHVLTLENPDQGIKQNYTVTIKSGETFSRSLGLK